MVPAASDRVTIAAGESVTLEGRIYPALPADAVVTLYAESDGVWRSQSVTTARHTQALPDGYSTVYSTYSVTVSPSATTRYYFERGSVTSPTTTVTVTG